MTLHMYLDDKLVDTAPLNAAVMQRSEDRADYLQGAIQELLEKWSDILDKSDVQPRFSISPDPPFSW